MQTLLNRYARKKEKVPFSTTLNVNPRFLSWNLLSFSLL